MANVSKQVTTADIRKKKEAGTPITMMTAYDYPSAKLVEEAGVDMILVGDSLGMVVLGYDSTLPVTMDDMVHHTKAVTRAAKRAFVVADLPFLSYHGTLAEAVQNAGRLMQEGLAKAVKMEGGSELAPIITRCVQAGIPVVGHIGLTPQAVHQLGGYKVQGRSLDAAKKNAGGSSGDPGSRRICHCAGMRTGRSSPDDRIQIGDCRDRHWSWSCV